MDYIICCGCSVLCFLCGAWAARSMPRSAEPKENHSVWSVPEDALSRDIAAMLAYTPNGEENTDEDS